MKLLNIIKNYKKKACLLVLLIILGGMLVGCSTGDAVSSEKTNRLEEIKERGYIEVATEPYFAPNQFIDPTKGNGNNIVGSDVELGEYIGEKLGVEVRLIPLEFGAVLSSVTDGKYDLAISALAYTPARAEAMNMSKGYYFPKGDEGYGLLIRKEDAKKIKTPEDIKDKTIVAQSGSLQELFVNEQVPEYKEFKRVSSTNDGLLMVQENKADVAAVSINMGELYIEANSDAGLMLVEDFRFEVDESTSGTRIGIPPGEDELTEEINNIIDEVVESGTYEQWYEEYTEYAKSLGL